MLQMATTIEYKLIPLDLIAVISLSEDSLPKLKRVAVKIDIGIEKINKEGIRERNKPNTCSNVTPLPITSSANLTKLPIIRTKLITIRARNKIANHSLKI